ncbi:Extracellular exo-alpha-(1-_5)-L-arabinofuranosidase precursor [compost metagenome]
MLACMLILTSFPLQASAASTTFINPVAPYSSADPHVMKHTDGYYYFVHTSQYWDKIDIVRSSSLSGYIYSEELSTVGDAVLA